MDIQKLDIDPESVSISSAADYEVSLALFHNSHGLPTPASADRRYAEDGEDKERRAAAAKRTNIWK